MLVTPIHKLADLWMVQEALKNMHLTGLVALEEEGVVRMFLYRKRSCSSKCVLRNMFKAFRTSNWMIQCTASTYCAQRTHFDILGLEIVLYYIVDLEIMLFVRLQVSCDLILETYIFTRGSSSGWSMRETQGPYSNSNEIEHASRVWVGFGHHTLMLRSTHV